VTSTGYPIEWEADVLLRDGHPVRLRPIGPDDAEALRRFHAALSAQSIYYRFFSAKPQLTDKDVAYFTNVDHRSRVALVALDRDEIIGVGRFDVLGDGSAEVAFNIRDAVQGRGLGSILLEHLAAAAHDVGVTRFVAEVLPNNTRMLATFREAGYELEQHREEDVIAVSFAIEPTEASVAVMAARELRAEARSMSRLLRPQSVAIVGASRSPGGLGHALLQHVVDAGFAGRLVAVHPEVDEIAGVRCVRSLADAGGEIDIAVVVVPAESVAGVIEDAGSADVRGLIIVSGGFGEEGPEGLLEQARIVSASRRAGMRVVGPNALGLINTDAGIRLNASLVPRMPLAGRVGFFCQSGALGSSILDRLRVRGVGLSTFVSAGNRADVSGNDLLQYWREDDATDVVLLYLESIGNARKFARLVHRTAYAKPVVMVRTGGSGHAHPLGHAVASTDLSQFAVDQILSDCGLILVDSVDELIDVGRIAATQPLPTGRAVRVIGNSDSLAVLAVNAMAGTGLASAGAPVTFARTESVDGQAGAVRVALADPEVGAVLVLHATPVEDLGDDDLLHMLESLAVDRTATKPVVAVMSSGLGAGNPQGLPVFEDVEDAVQALASVAWLARWRAADVLNSVRPRVPDEGQSDPPALVPGTVGGEAAARLVDGTGMPRIALDLDAAGSIGLVARLADDPLFGPVVMVGLDDPVAEALDDRAHRLAPVSPTGARAMLESLRSWPVLEHQLGEEALTSLAHAVSGLSCLHVRRRGITHADLRHASVGEGGNLTVGDISVTVSAAAIVADPAARRM